MISIVRVTSAPPTFLFCHVLFKSGKVNFCDCGHERDGKRTEIHHFFFQCHLWVQSITPCIESFDPEALYFSSQMTPVSCQRGRSGTIPSLSLSSQQLSPDTLLSLWLYWWDHTAGCQRALLFLKSLVPLPPMYLLLKKVQSQERRYHIITESNTFKV